MSASASFDASNLQRNVKELPEHVNRDVSQLFDYFAGWGTTWMKINAPWTDDTGAARSALIALAASMGSTHEMTLSNAVSYGIWLEVANSGRFQILGPAMRIIGANMMKSLQGMLDGKPPNLGQPSVEIPPQARKLRPKQLSNRSGNRKSRKAYGRKKQS
jgi:hypothetical protein